MRTLFIINEVAGKGHYIDLLEIKIKAHYSDALVEYTKRKGHATQIAKHYAKIGNEIIIFACGGDGTINEVINGIYGYDNVTLAIIPIGTGNDFIKSLPNSKEELLSIQKYQNSKVISCDIIRVNNRLALNIVSIGFDASVAKNVEKYKRYLKYGEKIPYYMSILYSLSKSIKYPLTLISEKTKYEDEFTFISVCNGQYYGGGYHPAPSAKINDGLLDIIMIKNVTRFNILSLARLYGKGEHIKKKKFVQCITAKNISILTKGELLVNLDGEILPMTDLEISIIPSAIKLLILKNSHI